MTRRLAAWFAALLLAAPISAQPALDHILLWTRDSSAAVATLEGLGFTVRRGGQYPEGMSSHSISFADGSFIELLHFDRPELAANNAQARVELAFVTANEGVNSFALRVDSTDAASARLRAAGLSPLPVEEESYDPDGASGPLPPQTNLWRDFHLANSPFLGTDLFFIAYPPDPPRTPEQQARRTARETHHNGAQSMTAVWMLVPDADAQAVAYRRIGAEDRGAVPLPALGASGRRLSMASGEIILLEPEGLGVAAVALNRRGPHVFGISVLTRAITSDDSNGPRGPNGGRIRFMGGSPLGLAIELHAPR